MNLCRCGRDEHEAPLSRTVAGFYDNHSFSGSYDPENDLSPIVCPGTWTEGPLRPNSRPTGNWTITFEPGEFSKSYHAVMQQSVDYGSSWVTKWVGDESLKMTAHTWMPFNDPGVLAAMNPTLGVLGNPSYDPQTNGWYHLGKLSDDGIKHDKANDQYMSLTWGGSPYPVIVGGKKPKYTSKGAKCTWKIYDESYNFLGEWPEKSPKKECAGDPPKFTFGPENWVKKPPPNQCWTAPWMQSYQMQVYGVPPLHSPAWKEPIPLPDLPVDYTEVVKQYNEQFSYAGVKK